jgi:hypothetical protein
VIIRAKGTSRIPEVHSPMHNKHQVERSTQVNLKYGPHKGICGDVILGNREAVMKSTEKSII